MAFMTSIINALNSVSSWFYEIYLIVLGWVWPFWQAATFFYQLHLLFNTLAWRFSDFSSWVTEVQGKVSQLLNWSTIWSYILTSVPNLTQIRDWFYSWWNNVSSVVTNWWSATQYTVQGWISVAVQPFNSMLTAWTNFWQTTWPGWVSSFNSLKSAWDNFWKVTFPTLVSFTWLGIWWNSRLLDIEGLINSAFTARVSLWAGWQDMRANVVEFFTDPLEFLWARFTDWFLGPEG